MTSDDTPELEPLPSASRGRPPAEPPRVAAGFAEGGESESDPDGHLIVFDCVAITFDSPHPNK